jgi:hypothetical protein
MPYVAHTLEPNNGFLNRAVIPCWWVWELRQCYQQAGSIYNVDICVVHAEQRKESHPRPDGVDSMVFHRTIQLVCNWKLVNFFISRIFHLVFLDCSWWLVTETVESGVADNGGLLNREMRDSFIIDVNKFSLYHEGSGGLGHWRVARRRGEGRRLTVGKPVQRALCQPLPL